MLHDTLPTSLWAFRPELVLCATIVLILLARLVAPGWKRSAWYVTLAGSALALYLVAPWHYLAADVSAPFGPIFSGMLLFDRFAIYLRGLLLAFILLFAVFTRLSGVVDSDDATEFYVLVLGATLGMCLMVSANHLLIVFLAVEMASVPSYVLAGFLKHRRDASEAALKFAVFGAATAGVMLYGISLLSGALGSAHVPSMALQLADMLRDGAGADRTMVLVLGGLMVTVGLAFKLSAVPFHQWAPDVFEGASAEVAALFSVASKTAALGLLVRLALGFGYAEQPAPLAAQLAAPQVTLVAALPDAPPSGSTLEKVQQLRQSVRQLRRLQREAPAAAAEPVARCMSPVVALAPVRAYLAGLIALLAAVTCTFGNLAAYGQTNIKRLLAYSTIAHAGYMMMPIAAALVLIGSDPAGARASLAALAFYVAVYMFMNLGVFAGVAFLRNASGSEQIADYAGLVRRSPGLAVCLAILLFSLVGLPPLAGFAAKFTVFAALFDAGMLGLLIIGALNTVLSLFYYLRVVKVMTLEPELPDGRAAEIPLKSPPGAFCLLVTLPVVVLGIWWEGLLRWAEAAAGSLLM